jgi:hypothetical protein
MARVALPQSKIRAKRKKRRLRIAAFCAGVFVVAFVGLAFLSHASFMRIDSVDVAGAQTILANDVQAQVLKSVQGSYLFIFPKDNIFLYPKSAAEAALKASVPTISTDQIGAENFHTLKVTITERTKKALWCPQDDANLAAGVVPQDCALLDQDGVVYASAVTATDTVVYFGPLAGNTFPQTYLPAEQFHSLSALVDALKTQSQNATDTPIAVELEGADVHVRYQSGFTLIFLLSSAGADVFSHFQLALSSAVFAKHMLSDFEYLDLRFGDKLYYKLRDAQTPSINSK